MAKVAAVFIDVLYQLKLDFVVAIRSITPSEVYCMSKWCATIAGANLNACLAMLKLETRPSEDIYGKRSNGNSTDPEALPKECYLRRVMTHIKNIKYDQVGNLAMAKWVEYGLRSRARMS